MRGVVLAGGTGSRLHPLTACMNKHLLPVFDKPMIFYPIETLRKAKIRDILIILGGQSIETIIRFLGDGSRFGINLTYRFQERPGGIAEAVALAEDFTRGEKFAVILGDNILFDDVSEVAASFEASELKAVFSLKRVPDPGRFGAAVFRGDRLVRIIEKPSIPPSNLVVTGLYFYSGEVFELARHLRPSERGELEITDLNNALLAGFRPGLVGWFELKEYWADVGTIESLSEASTFVRESATTRGSEAIDDNTPLIDHAFHIGRV